MKRKDRRTQERETILPEVRAEDPAPVGPHLHRGGEGHDDGADEAVRHGQGRDEVVGHGVKVPLPGHGRHHEQIAQDGGQAEGEEEGGEDQVMMILFFFRLFRRILLIRRSITMAGPVVVQNGREVMPHISLDPDTDGTRGVQSHESWSPTAKMSTSTRRV